MYLFGVCKFLQEHGLTKNAKLSGSSAGALAATALALDCDFDEIRKFVLNNALVSCHEHWTGAFRVREYLEETFDNVGNLHKYVEVNKRQNLAISITSLPWCGNTKVTSFDNELDLKSALFGSCCATPIAGFPFKRKGVWVFDGGLSQFQPYVDEGTVTISPLYCANADIKPSRYVPLWWAVYPPSRESIEWLFELGYHDAREWAENNGHVPYGTAERTKTVGSWSGHFGRVVGYDAVESRVMDLLLVTSLFLIWKPISFALLYLELILRALISGGKAAIFGSACIMMIMLAVTGVTIAVMPWVLPFKVFMFSAIGLALFMVFQCFVLHLVGGMEKALLRAKKDWGDCMQCLRSIISLSLLLRTLPFYGSRFPLAQKKLLQQHSFIYRVVAHYI